MFEHAKCETPDLAKQNLEKLKALFPGVVTEGPDGKMLKKHIYDYLLSDSKGERKFAKELDNADEVEVFAKLPS